MRKFVLVLLFIFTCILSWDSNNAHASYVPPVFNPDFNATDYDLCYFQNYVTGQENMIARTKGSTGYFDFHPDYGLKANMFNMKYSSGVWSQNFDFGYIDNSASLDSQVACYQDLTASWPGFWFQGTYYNYQAVVMTANITQPPQLIPEATDFVFPVLGISQADPLTNIKDPLTDGWAGKGLGQRSAADGHLGQDYYSTALDSAGKPIFAVANGEIVEVLNGPGIYGWCDNDDHGWGPVVVIKHYLSSGFKICSSAIKDPGNCGTDLNPTVVYSLYGHLSKESIKDLYKGQIVNKGQQIGAIGQYGVDLVSWTTSHLHFELKDQFAFDSEGTWYTNRSHDGVCPEPTTYMCSAREIKGVGAGYSHVLGFAPHRYIPITFLLSNMVNPPQTLTVSTDTNSSFTSVQDAYNSMTKNGQSLQMQAQVFSENLNLNNNLAVLLKGGYDSTYQTNSGWTTLFGSLTISSGSLEVDRMCIQ